MPRKFTIKAAKELAADIESGQYDNGLGYILTAVVRRGQIIAPNLLAATAPPVNPTRYVVRWEQFGPSISDPKPRWLPNNCGHRHRTEDAATNCKLSPDTIIVPLSQVRNVRVVAR